MPVSQGFRLGKRLGQLSQSLTDDGTIVAGSVLATSVSSVGGVDSAAIITLIDSNYIQARQTAGGGVGGVDSAAIISLIDSNYVQARQTAGGGGGGSNTKTYRYQGRLAVTTGEIRKYFNANATMSSIDAYVSTAPTGANLTVVVKKNGTTAETFSITAGNTSNTGISATASFAAGDYMTIDITQVGSSFAGQDLYVVFNF